MDNKIINAICIFFSFYYFPLWKALRLILPEPDLLFILPRLSLRVTLRDML